MFISRRKYEKMQFSISEHDRQFADIILNAEKTERQLSERIQALEEAADAVLEDRKREKDFFDGFTNILNYSAQSGVEYGQKSAE
jgi:hypothetical protein